MQDELAEPAPKAELSKELIKTVMGKISNGIPYLHASEDSGMEESTFYKWRKEAALALKRVEDVWN